MKLPSTKISTKVRNSVVSAALVSVVVGFVSDSPIGNSEWGRTLKNPATVGGLITVISALVGYQTEEESFSENQSPQDI